ncbi:MAG: hypothetical protein MH137_09000 [Flavobacteriales bacterium]|nr:hypothetical protein [Flavobacteriales bacterium]
MGRLLASFIGVYFFSFALYAQSARDYGAPHFSIKTNVLAFVNPLRPALFVSSDYFISPRWSVDAGAGWFFGTALQPNMGESFNGLRTRFGMKYLFPNRRTTTPYIGCEVKYHYIREKNYEWLSRAGGQYNEITLLGLTRNTGGLAFRGGAHFYFGKRKSFLMDLYAGVGYRFTRMTRDPIPEDAVLANFGVLGFDDGDYHLPDILFGVNLGYLFRKK